MTSIVMYHYIRKFDHQIKNLNFLHQNNFNKQLKFFNRNFDVFRLSNDLEKFDYSKNKILLTFDDGLKEHLSVARILKKKNIKGIFFISSKPLIDRDFLTVHKIHLILGKNNDEKIRELFQKFNLIKHLKKKSFDVFLNQKNLLKKIKNLKKKNEIYYKVCLNLISQKQPEIIDNLFDYCFNKKEQKQIFKDFYLNKKDIMKMMKMGMEIGSHGHSHKVLSLMKKKDQLKDIKKCVDFLKKIVGKPINFFSYPYGGSKTYNKNTLSVLKKLKIKKGISVDSRKLNKNDSLLEIPRFDCNDFPYGKAFIKNEKK